LPGTTVSVGDTLCGTFPEAMLEKAWYYFECPEGTVGEYVKVY